DESQDAVRGGERDRGAGAQISGELHRRRIAIARTNRVEDALVRQVVCLQRRKGWPERAADAGGGRRARDAESELRLRQVVELVDDGKFCVAPGEHLLRLELMVVAVALLGIGGER